MSTIHFLNVNEGDCCWISHNSARVTVIDVCNAKKVEAESISESLLVELSKLEDSLRGNFNQKKYPVNPIKYLKDFNVTTIFRFILTHPDMDHMDGIKNLFESFSVVNFWDVMNNKNIKDFPARYSEDDWKFYLDIRDGSKKDVTRLILYNGAEGKFYNQSEDGSPGGDGLHILSPTTELVKQANQSDDYNDCSYVILYITGNGKKILFCGDSASKSWEHILNNYKDDVTNIDILIAPHHGRKQESYDFLDVTNPKMTYFGNASSDHLAYNAWNYRNLPFITNNQANCIITDINYNNINIYVTYEVFARKINTNTYYDNTLKGWYVCTI